MSIEIIATGKAIPSTRLTNSDLMNRINTSDEWIRSHTGIGARHIADEDTACSDLALGAAKNALAMAAGFEGPAEDPAREAAIAEAALSLDMIVLATATADYYGCPSTACIVQDKLGAKNAGAMDIGAGCTGFIYALETAAGLLSINPGRKRALVIGSEELSRITDWSDRNCVLFGDGAGAVIIEKTPGPQEGAERRGLLRTILRADGSGAEFLIFRRGGSRYPFKVGETLEKPIHIEMNGRAVYNFAVKAITETIENLLEQEGITVEDLRRIIPHQANARIVQAAGKRMDIPEEKFFLNIEDYANTSAASIPIALDEMNRGGQLRRGDLIMTVGFGGGLTYGGNLIIW
ncbi:MAG: ketoacyl-ACP synthase III [Treponema sp.]|jgi:3-oxoacyl-[acyl-carrier-protein] synthase-3|nr:ketoacyl-ACP synthase III [Treponema sp.]